MSGEIVAPVVALDDPTAATANALSINAALADPATEIALLPVGDIYINTPIIVPSARWLRGSGRGMTRLIGTPDISDVTGGPGIVTIREDAAASVPCIGAKVSDLTAVGPKIGTKVQGVWARNARYFVVENVEVIDCGYAFWAQDYAQYGVFRNIRSRNANVHFETTRAFDILFDGMESDDGDGDNPLGYEGVWHTLFGSKRITFRNGRHLGSGQPYLVVANTGQGDEGLVDDILFDQCHAENTDGKICLFVSRISSSASVGRVRLLNCNLRAVTIAAPIQVGDVEIRGGSWSCGAQQGIIAYAGTRITTYGLNISMSPPPGAFGYIYIANGDAKIRVLGGRVETNSDKILLSQGFNVIAREVEFLHPSIIYGPTAIGQRVQYVYPVDLPRASGEGAIGAGVAGQPSSVWAAAAGFRYRLVIRGKMKKTGTAPNLYLELAANPGSDRIGAIEIEKSDGTFARSEVSAAVPASNGNVRQFKVDISLTGVPNNVNVYYGGGTDGATILKGAELTIERIA